MAVQKQLYEQITPSLLKNKAMKKNDSGRCVPYLVVVVAIRLGKGFWVLGGRVGWKTAKY